MVPKGKRNTGKLAVIDKAYDLLENTYAWVANDKIIPNRHKYRQRYIKSYIIFT